MLLLMGFVVIVIGTASFYVTSRVGILIGYGFNSQVLYSLVSLSVFFIPFLLQILDHFFVNKFFSILATLGTWMIVFVVLFAVFLGIEHGISTLLQNFSLKIHGFRIFFFGIVGPVLLARGLYNAFSTQTTEIIVNTPKIAKELKILFVSDIHVNDLISTRHLKTLSRKLDQIKPDLVLFGGDFFDKANVRHAKYYQILGNLDRFSTIGYAVAGNHDLMGDRNVFDRVQEFTNIQRLSVDQVASNILTEMGIQMLALPDKYQWKGGKIETLLQQITIDPNYYTILLTHQPISLDKLKNFPVDLTLAGHTHRGQVYGVRELVALVNDYGYGLFKQGEQQTFVSQGIGAWGFPFRLGSRSEIVMITLQPES